MTETFDLHTKYRPEDIDGIYGHDVVVRSLKEFKKTKKWPHSFLLTGHTGSGKTTIARVIANELNCDPENIVEVDAASISGVDQVRDLFSSTKYRGFGDNPTRVYIIDEAHRISKQSWDVALKTIEEPPEHCYFIFCTTESGKVPKTIVSRCISYTLSEFKPSELEILLEDVVDAEKLDVIEGLIPLIAKESNGSPRYALVNLMKTYQSDSLQEAAKLLQSASETKEVIDLARLLVSGQGCDWKTCMKIVQDLPDESEGTRLVVLAYVTKVITSAKDKDLPRLAAILQAFCTGPWSSDEKKAPLMLALAQLIA